MSRERLLDTSAAAELVGVSPGLISKWKERGLLTPAGLVRGKGRGGLVPLYKAHEVRACANKFKHASADTQGVPDRA